MKSDLIIYNSDDGKVSVAMFERDGNVWMNQSQIAELFDTSLPNISMHISNILKEKELEEHSVIKNYLTTANDGKNYNVAFYSLEMILAIGFRVRSVRGRQFRQWANRNLQEYLVKGFLIDDHRLKNPDGRPDYYDELVERIRDIRASEKRFYQKIRELFALSIDYDPASKSIQAFFAETQNKLLYAVCGQTAAEIIVHRANENAVNMNLTSWEGSIVRKSDIYIAKNYLKEDELDTLNRLVIVFLETAELRAKNRNNLTIKFWQENVDKILELNDKQILSHKGSISNEEMKKLVSDVYSRYDEKRKKFEAQYADEKDIEELKQLDKSIKSKNKK